MQELKHRRAARIIVLDPKRRVMLFRHAGSNGRSFWATPGGGLEDGETFEQAAYREIAEELGVTGGALRFLWEETNNYFHFNDPVQQQERYFLLEGAQPELLVGVEAVHRREGILETRWWTRAELESASEPLFPEELAAKLNTFSGG
jgi:ADP-ribose pyrophosphatase YjhB (NUDIX family)